jgi:hypothetical protein
MKRASPESRCLRGSCRSNSDAYLVFMNAASGYLHPDFGSNPAYGIPFIGVAGSQARVPMSFQYADESDPGPYPFPPDAPIEGGPSSSGDRHVIIVDRDNCMLYETFSSYYVNPGWQCGSGAAFDLRSNHLRPDGWTSADAAGLPILPALVRYDELQLGEIKHAFRFTMRTTQRAHVHPATHFANSVTNPNAPPMGLRLRLKAGYDVSRFSGSVRVIRTALKHYGMFLADNGSDWYISGETTASWNDDELNQLRTVPASAFEVVQLTGIYH